MSDPLIKSIRTILQRRYDGHINAWGISVARRFPEISPKDAIKSIEPLGGFYFQGSDINKAQKQLPEVVDILRLMMITRSKYTHGGYYYFADPAIYLKKPSWLELRYAVEYRLELILNTLPKFINASTLNYSSWLILIALLDMVRTDIATIYWNELWLYYLSYGGEKREVHRILSIDNFMKWAVQVTLELLPSIGSSPIGERILLSEQPLLSTLPRIKDFRWRNHPTSTDCIRSRREGDSLFLIWASLQRLAEDQSGLSEQPFHFFGNAFGALDIGYFCASYLRLNGYSNVSQHICRYAAKHSIDIDHIGDNENETFDSKLLVFGEIPDLTGAKVFFCDDSILTGQVFRRFKQSVIKFNPLSVDGFFITFDINTNERLGKDYQIISENFSLAKYAAYPSFWATEKDAPDISISNASRDKMDSFIVQLQNERDLQLRHLGNNNAFSIREINKKIPPWK